MNPTKHAAIALKHLREQTPEVVLFYSGGKDSLVLLDLLAPHFKVHCFFMYFVKNLRHLNFFLEWVKRYPNATLHQLPHWMVSYYIKHNYFSIPTPGRSIKALKQADIEGKAREISGCDWIVFGHKKADSMNRRIMLSTYKFDCINDKGKKIYPLALWTKRQVKSYIQINNIIKPIEYGAKNSNGLDLNIDVFLYLREFFPDDLEKIFNIFPLSRQILYEYDYEQRNR